MQKSAPVSGWEYETALLDRNVKVIAGVDEVGRGPLAGPVVAAAVILPTSLIDSAATWLADVRDSKQGPVLIHVVTQKGKGYKPAETSSDKYHGVAKFNVVTGEQKKGAAKAPSYTSVFANALIKEAERDKDIVAITAAMPSGTGIDKFAEAFPDRAFDVGIAEQHAITIAAGMATEGLKPFATIYSTFLQRA